MTRKHPGSLRWRQLAAPALVLALIASILLSIVSLWALAVPVLYLVTLGLAGVVAGKGATSIGKTLALTVMHVSWGIGFLTH
jgi:succinoglycan biosynthesis protein ExoA